jgi:hypothetical protein
VSARTVGVLHYPLGHDFGYERLPKRRPRRVYRRTLWWKANPRGPDYMRALFAERYPAGELYEGSTPPPADTTVLLFPDAIGLGFGSVERRLAGRPGLRALNGRRRDFPLDPRTRRRLALRRLLERTMLLEALALPGFAFAGALLWVVDALRGRT